MKKIIKYEICLTKPEKDLIWYYITYEKEEIQKYIDHAIARNLDIKYIKGLTR